MGRSLFVLLSLSTLPAAAGDLERLGRQLFFDKRLSADGSLSCAMCHRPDSGFADPNPVSRGVGGVLGKFNAPTVLNLQRARRFFWDGRAASLEEQAQGPLLNPIEMGNRREDLEARLSAIEAYRRRFEACFGDPAITLERISSALAAYQRTLYSTHSLYTLWRRGQRDHWSAKHELGRRLFFGKARCAACHSGPNFTNGQLADAGNGLRLKVPSLRELSHTAPYFHDGSAPDLPTVLDTHMGARSLSAAEKSQLLLFLEALSGEYSR